MENMRCSGKKHSRDQKFTGSEMGKEWTSKKGPYEQGDWRELKCKSQ